ncbi:hypothetical protein [Winogradskyella sp.]|uniref:hypothetical protein n=1 Tax=Winogradskyella sp. TaxID=1883156 RepID=UPI0025F44558|nr:hypothetical protein [Winogradskyella sp.]MBT8245289.1 hypothetical protein [Winogradskyella sp.]
MKTLQILLAIAFFICVGLIAYIVINNKKPDPANDQFEALKKKHYKDSVRYSEVIKQMDKEYWELEARKVKTRPVYRERIVMVKEQPIAEVRREFINHLNR